MKKIISLSCICWLFACNNPHVSKSEAGYFDLKGYFESEAKRLNNNSLQIKKTVSINGVKEEKNLKIADFKKEFNVFMDADINKLSWKGEFTVKQDSTTQFYLSESDKIPVKKLEIQFKRQQVKQIKIFIVNTNILYTGCDTLYYYPDSLYEIRKSQKIKLLAPKHFTVKGEFLH